MVAGEACSDKVAQCKTWGRQVCRLAQVPQDIISLGSGVVVGNSDCQP